MKQLSLLILTFILLVSCQDAATPTIIASVEQALATATQRAEPTPTRQILDVVATVTPPAAEATATLDLSDVPTPPPPTNTPLPTPTDDAPVDPVSDYCSRITSVTLNECETLTTIYHQNGGPGWADSSQWLNNGDLCKWEGITCISGLMRIVDLSNKGLHGPLLADLSGLVHTDQLILHHNNLTSALPESLAYMRRLRSADFSNNQFTGAIPASYSQLTTLEALNVNNNIIMGTLPPELATLPQLGWLDVSHNPMQGIIDPAFAALSYFNVDATELTWEETASAEPTATTARVEATPTSSAETQPPTTLPVPPTDPALIAKMYDCNRQSRIPFAECEALVAIYIVSNGPQWEWSTGWLSINDPCQWYGVQCNNWGVTELSLYHNDLAGSIAPELGRLTSLRRLDLNDNGALQGPIPDVFGELQHLETINLAYNQLSGPFPPSLTSIASLQRIHLAHNQLSGPLPTAWQPSALRYIDVSFNQLSGPLPQAWQSLTALDTIFVNHNKLTGELPAVYQTLHKLESFYANDNQLSGILPAEWATLSMLAYLDVTNNRLTGELPIVWETLATLQTLNASGNALNGTLPGAWANIPNLEVLNVADNQLTGSLPANWPNMFKPNTGNPYHDAYQPGMRHLNVDNNQLSGTIPNAYFVELGVFRYAGNQFSNGVHAFDCSNVGQIESADCNVLKTIFWQFHGANNYYFENWLESNQPCSWAGIVCAGARISELDLSGSYSGTLPAEIGNLTALTKLHVIFDIDCWGGPSSCLSASRSAPRLHGSIPNSLANLTNLRSLVIRGHNIEGPIPPSFGNLTQLETLVLRANIEPYGNHSTGINSTIPASLGRLTKLKELTLYGNLTGEIPAELGQLTQLVTLTLRSTLPDHLHGTIPSTLGNLTQLQAVSLYDNAVTGSLPLGWKDANNLALVHISSHGLCLPNDVDYVAWWESIEYSPPLVTCDNVTSPTTFSCTNVSSIPADECAALTALYWATTGWTFESRWLYTNDPCVWLGIECRNGHIVYLSVPNQLTGSLSPRITDLRQLEELHLTFSPQLTGSLPPDLGRLTQLTWISISGTSIGGPIPDSLGDLPNLTWLDLGVNQLSGPVPASLGRLAKLKYLALQNNQLNGELPSELGQLTSAETVWVNGNAQLSGPIPDTLKNLWNLRDLRLEDTALCIPSTLLNWYTPFDNPSNPLASCTE